MVARYHHHAQTLRTSQLLTIRIHDLFLLSAQRTLWLLRYPLRHLQRVHSTHPALYLLTEAGDRHLFMTLQKEGSIPTLLMAQRAHQEDHFH
jgi:hypothetical protein